MFSQVDRHHSAARGGLGIGLSLSRRLVEMHRGNVTAESEGLGKGSCFTVRLPLISADRPKIDVAPSYGAFAVQRVLVVDDNRDAADSLSAILQALGIETRVAHGGEQALVLVQGWLPHLVLLDLGMPGMDGYEVARRLRATQAGSLIIVALTGWGQESDRQRTQGAGFDHHLVKPIDLPTLRALLAGRFTPAQVYDLKSR